MQGREALQEDPQTYLNRLRELEVDIWFSLEGTPEWERPGGILDGDLLSAVSGSIVVPNTALLDPPVPAGLPDRGVDLGLDAVTGDPQAQSGERSVLDRDPLPRRAGPLHRRRHA